MYIPNRETQLKPRHAVHAEHRDVVHKRGNFIPLFISLCVYGQRQGFDNKRDVCLFFN